MRNRKGPRAPATPSLAAALAAAVAGVTAVAGCSNGSPGGGPNGKTEPAPAAQAAALKAVTRAPTLTPQQSGTTKRLQAVSPVDARVVWASGIGGTFALTTDGGATWRARVVPGAETLQFRDVQGVSDRVAYLLAAGVGTDSRIYKTEDGGDTWRLQFQNEDPNGFYDCFAFWSPERGVTMADSINGRFPVIQTIDGEAWRDVGERLPAALPGEAAFAASGTCAATHGSKRAWLATAGAPKARVLATTNGGKTWAAYDTPIVQGTPSSGAASVAFRDRRHGIVGGGDLNAPAELSDNVARSRDGGRTWQLAGRSPFPGAIFGLSYALGRAPDDRREPPDGPEADDEGGPDDERGRDRVTVVATGPGGAAWSHDEGETWTLLEGVSNYWAVAFADEHAGWLVGTEGRIVKIEF